MRSINITFLVAAPFGFAFTVQGSDTSLESNIKPRLATDEVENQISMDREANPLYESALLSPIKDWRGGVAEKTGFNWSLDYSALLMGVSDSSGEDNAADGMIAEKVYFQAGISDANSDPTESFDGFDSVANDSDFFKWIEIGFTPKQDKLYFDNTHITFWQIDERVNGTPDGWGINASWQKWIDDKWLPFVRGGYTEDSGSLLERSLTVGVGYQPVPMRGVIGFGFNWGRPNETSFGDLDDQYTTELFWRYQLIKELAVTPSIQYINNPALNEDEDNLWAFGLRVRVAL